MTEWHSYQNPLPLRGLPSDYTEEPNDSLQTHSFRTLKGCRPHMLPDT